MDSSNSDACHEIFIDRESGISCIPPNRLPPTDGEDAEDRVGEPHCPSSYPRRPSSFLTGAKTRSRLIDEEDEEDSSLDEDPASADDHTKQVLCTILILIASLILVFSFPALRQHSLWGFRLWKWMVLLLVLVCGRPVSGQVVGLILFSVQRSFHLPSWLYFICGARESVQSSIWLSLVAIALNMLFDLKDGNKAQTQATVLSYCNKVLICLIVGTALCLVKTVLVSYFVSSFHISTYFDRIREAIFNQYIIERLSGNSQNTRVMDITLPDGSQNVSASMLKMLMNIVRKEKLSTLDPQFVNSNENRWKQIRSEQDAKDAARKIFCHVVKPDTKYIELLDLACFMKEDEAIKTIKMFEGAGGRRITLESLEIGVVNVFRERRALALTLKDTKAAVAELKKLANCTVGIIVFVISLLILGFTTIGSLVLLNSHLLLVTLIFGTILKTVFEDMLFFFVTHPYDVGDRCEIGGDQLIVEEMNIHTTTFLNYQNMKITYPNHVLSTLPIGNYYRSPDMVESIDFYIHVSTPAEKLSFTKERLKGFLEHKKDHWHPNSTVVIKDIDNMNKVKISICMRHRMNFQEMSERWNRREHVVEELISILRDLNIEFLPVDVNLQALPPV